MQSVYVVSLTKPEVQQCKPDTDLGNFLLCLNTFKSEPMPFLSYARDFWAISCTLAHNILSSASVIPEFICIFQLTMSLSQHDLSPV